MKMKRLVWGFFTIAAVALLAGCGGGGGTSLMIGGERATQDAIDQLVQDLSDTQDDLTTANNDLTTANNDLTTANNNLTTANNDLTAANGTLTTIGEVVMAALDLTEAPADVAQGVRDVVSKASTAETDLTAYQGYVSTIRSELGTRVPADTTDDQLPGIVETLVGDIVTLNDTITTLNGTITTLNGTITTLNDRITTLENDLANNGVTEDSRAGKIEMAIAAPGTLNMLDSEAFAVTAGAVGTPPTMTIGADRLGMPDAAIVDENEFTRTPGTAVGDFTRDVHTRTTVDGTNDMVTVLGNIEAAGDVAYDEFYSTTDASSRDAVTSATAAGVLTLDTTDLAGNSGLFESTNFPAATTEEGLTRDSMYETDADKTFSGSFNGVGGTYTCTGTCTAMSNNDGLSALGGAWIFTPDAVAENADPHMITGVNYDADYLAFGYWLRTAGTGADMTYNVGALATGSMVFDVGNATAGMEALTGTARYTGSAIGLYVMKTDLNNDNMGPVPTASGEFTAETSLTANFDTDNISGYTINGMVTGFKDGNNEIDNSWALTLDPATYSNRAYSSGAWSFTGHENTFTGTTTGGENTDSGTWNGTFYGPNANADNEAIMPSGVAGDFTGNFTNGTVLGAFGAEKNP